MVQGFYHNTEKLSNVLNKINFVRRYKKLQTLIYVIIVMHIFIFIEHVIGAVCFEH